MLPVVLQVEHVVEQIDARSTGAEAQECQHATEYQRQLQHLVGGQQGHEHQQVLGPLVQPQRLAPDAEVAAAIVEHLAHASELARPRQHTTIGIGNVRDAGLRPDGVVGAGIADVLEPALAITRHQRITLVPRGEVMAFSAEHLVEDGQVIGNAARQPQVGRSGQHQLHAIAALRVEPGQQGLVVRQRFGQRADLVGQLALEIRFALEQPQQHFKDAKRRRAQEQEHALHQQVRMDQGAVEVDDDGAGSCHALMA